MPKQALKAEFKNFSRGLFTEFSELNFPENAFQDGVNFEIQRDGSLNRRNGLDFEVNYSLITSSVIESALVEGNYSMVKWESAGGNPDFDFAVVQLAHYLFIFNTTSETLSTGGLRTTLTLSTFSGFTKFSIVNVKGALVVVCGSKKVGLVKFNPATETFSVSYFSIKTRDFWGVPAKTITAYDTDPQYRGAEDLGHIYNLYNQSWGIPRKNSAGVLTDPLSIYKTAHGKFPSNTETVWAGLQFQAAATPFERVYPNLYEEVLGASNKAAKGYFVIDALDRGTSRATAIIDNGNRNPALTYKSISMDLDSTTGGATVVAEYAGRVVYAGFNGETVGATNRSPDLSDHIFFSQLVNNERDYEKCYQDGDPTSRENADIVDTDGGYIRISGAKKIVAMRPLSEGLVIVATNGVWVVRGGSEDGFKASNYKVEKVTLFGCIGDRSVVDDGEQLLYWGGDGIFNVMQTQTGTFIASSISEKSIQSFYNDIPTSSKKNVVGVYDTFAKKVRWIYQTDGMFSGSNELVLDLTLGAFYPISIGTSGNMVADAISLPSFRVVNIDTEVEAGGQIVVSGVDTVIVSSRSEVQNVQSLRYLTIVVSGGIIKFSFSFYRNTSFLDWNTVDASGFILTADFTNNDSSVPKQTPWIVTHMRKTDTGIVDGNLVNTSGCLLSSRWDWTNSNSAHKWSTAQQIYRPRVYMTLGTYDSGYRMVSTKNKMRGIGRAFNLHFATEPAKDCKLVGWSISLNGNGIV